MTQIGTRKTTVKDVKEKVMNYLKSKNNMNDLLVYVDHLKDTLNNHTNDKIWIDLYKLSVFDLTHDQRYFRNYLKVLLNYYSNFDEKYKDQFLLYKEYYVEIFEIFYNLRSTYLFGRIYGSLPTDIMVRVENRIFDDVLREIHEIYICNLSSEMQEYYYYIQNNDPYGLAKNITDKFGFPDMVQYNNIIDQMSKELQKFDNIYFVKKSPVSVKRTLSEFTKIYKRYLKDSGMYDEYHDKYVFETSKNEAKICKEIFEKYLDSDVSGIYYFYTLNYPSREYTKDKVLVEQFYPDLYCQVMSKIDSEQSQRYAILCKDARAVRDAIVKEKYKLSILDFLRLTNIRGTEKLIYYKKEIIKRLPDDCSGIISSYLRKINMQQILPETVHSSVVCCNGKYLADEDKEKILSYIKDNDLPYIDSVYMAIYREYLNDKLDLDKPFK